MQRLPLIQAWQLPAPPPPPFGPPLGAIPVFDLRASPSLSDPQRAFKQSRQQQDDEIQQQTFRHNLRFNTATVSLRMAGQAAPAPRSTFSPPHDQRDKPGRRQRHPRPVPITTVITRQD